MYRKDKTMIRNLQNNQPQQGSNQLPNNPCAYLKEGDTEF